MERERGREGGKREGRREQGKQGEGKEGKGLQNRPAEERREERSKPGRRIVAETDQKGKSTRTVKPSQK